MKNVAETKGGVIGADLFTNLTIGNCKFNLNMALEGSGDDISAFSSLD